MGVSDQNTKKECSFCRKFDIYASFVVVKLLIYNNIWDIIRSISYAVDVGSDIGTGISFYKGEPLNNSRLSCDDPQGYSHTTWGAIAISLTWSPALPFMVSWLLAVIEYPFLVLCSMGDPESDSLKVKSRKERITLGFIVFPIWPIIGFFL